MISGVLFLIVAVIFFIVRNNNANPALHMVAAGSAIAAIFEFVLAARNR